MSTPPTRTLQSDETPQDIARKGYNAHAQEYLDWTTSKPSSRLTYLNKVLALLQPDSSATDGPHPPTSPPSPVHKVLELGCGAGIPVTLHLAQLPQIAHVTAVDISSTQLEMLRSNLVSILATEVSAAKTIAEKVELVEADMLELAFEEASFSAVTAFFSIIHLPREDQRTMVQRIFGWLRPGGYLLANFGAQSDDDKKAVAEQGNVSEVAAERTGEQDGQALKTGSVTKNWLGMTAYWDSFGPERTKEVLREAGFEVVVADIVEEVEDAVFLWVIARKPLASSS
ncbi:hypothetical protein H2198_001839 [Neophaeococcomyces mojaviensis]|uniref:Uncharacterized protein n=1 Tax=Neophaeococcomyces mojaviensis TaxID=3383035 RepID=A0ACC3AFY3_9EURO|nr:hypothetical protein H2198_001839 [Knufia sp. JES_112]